MSFKEKIKGLFQKDPSNQRKDVDLSLVTIYSMEYKYENDDLVGAAKDLKLLLEAFGRSKKKNHRYKGRTFIHFILSNKHKNLKNTGYIHWENLNQIIILNHKKVYPYHKSNLRKAMDFFMKEVKSINSFRIPAEEH